MALTGAQVTVGTTATSLAPATTTGQDWGKGQSLTFWSTVAVAIGGSGVTWATGAQLPANTALSLDLVHDEAIYAAVQTGTATVHVVHQGV